MNICRKRLAAAVALAIAAAAAYAVSAQEQSRSVQSRLTFSGSLPRMDGERLTVKVVEVIYGPGGFCRPHSHPCPVIGYVVEGALRMHVQGTPEAVYTAGQSFYEPPNGVHQVSANASDSVPAKFIVQFICDKETELSHPVANPDFLPTTLDTVSLATSRQPAEQ